MGKKTFIVAELSSNHNNDFEFAVKTIKAIAKSGADAVKIQTYKPESLTLNLNEGYFAPIKDGLWKGKTPWELYQNASMPYEWQSKLKQIAENEGLIFFSSPFDIEGVDFLESLNVNIYKIASLEIVDIPLIEYCAKKQKPMIISTGAADLKDIELAIKTCHEVGNTDVTLLKCTSNYPSQINEANLLTIPDMKIKFGVKVGISDHTLGTIVPIAAVSLGATIVEKHFILDKKIDGIDSSFSLEPKEFTRMVNDIRNVETSLGSIDYNISEKDKLRRRSLFVVRDIKLGEKLSISNVRSIRPGYGLHPKEFKKIINKTVKQDVKKGTPLSWNMISDN